MSLDGIFPLELFPRCADAGLRVGMPANVAAHTRELCGGVYLAVADYAGAPVEVVWKNDRRDPETAREVAREYAGLGFRAIVGHLSASAALPAAEVYHENRILFLAPGTSHPDLTSRGFDTVFRVCGRDDRQGEELARWARSNPAWERVKLVEQDIVYGQILSRFIRNSWGTSGPALTSMVGSFGDGSGHRLCRELLAGDPDLVLVAGIHELSAELMRSLRSAGYTGDFLLSDDGFTPELIRLAGEAAEGAYVLSLRFPLEDPEVARLARRYLELTGSEAGAYFLTSYSAMRILLQAFDQGGTGAEEAAALLRSREWPSPLGPLRFAGSGEVEGIDWQPWQVRSGRFEPLNDSLSRKGT